jgi:hypothetical protein
MKKDGTHFDTCAPDFICQFIQVLCCTPDEGDVVSNTGKETAGWRWIQSAIYEQYPMALTQWQHLSLLVMIYG